MVAWRQVIAREAPDPEDALRQFRRLEEAAQAAAARLPETADAARVATLCCQRAPYLARLLARDPHRLGRVARDPYLRRQKPAGRLAEELAERVRGADSAASLASALRRFRADELVRCGVRELDTGKPIEVGAELAHLADACFDAAIDFHRAELVRRWGEPIWIDASGAERRAELCVIGMGKLGGEELNFASDVDVIYVYSSDAAPEGAEISLHEFFSELCRRVTTALGEVTEEDVVFRVDLRLRPEGSRGAIANSLPSLERYYESWGRPWERQAWLKARPCAGSAELGAEIMEMMRPFVYRRSMSIDVVREVESLNTKIKTELDRSSVESGFDVKNGEGGIREVEFFVQALQLIWAGRLVRLRTRSTVGALDQLLFAGIISEAERRALASAYRFLRRVEHLLQLESGRQTQRLPARPEAFALLGRRLGFAGAPALSAELERHTAAVAELFATLGAGQPASVPEVEAVLSGRLDPDDEVDALAALGFRDPERAAAHLERSRRLASSPLGLNPQGAAARVAAPLFTAISRSPDPDQALAYVVELASRRGSFASIWRLMDESSELLRLVASLLGTSHYLSRQFVGHPELIDQLVLAGRARPLRARDEIAAALESQLSVIEPGDEEGRWNALAELRNEEVLRIGLADIAGDLSPLEVCTELTGVADVVLAGAFAMVEEAVRARHGWPHAASGDEIGFAAFALGKHGGGELGYASDLDLVFVYSPGGDSDGPRPLPAVTLLSRFAQRLMGGLGALHPSGRIYEVDTRLRPSGSQGLLVSSLPAWRRYHRERAQMWERQALIKLRHVAGDPELGRLIEGEVAEFLYGEDAAVPSAGEIAAGVRRMRERIERELAGRGLDLKVGRGGLIDIEFAAQYLQLAWGRRHPELRTRSTMVALERASELELAPRESLAVLADGYRFLRFLEHRMRIVHDRSVHALPEGGPELEKLARRAGYSRAEQLTAEFLHYTESVRRAFETVVVG